jgi:UDP-3-O-[3-hydroxymyristoyl] glucosamine N-acyltransferase
VLHPRVTLYPGVTLGARAIVHAGTVIGADGFGFAPSAQGWVKIAQLGSVRIGDDVEIGANCSIDRGALDDTVIGSGCKLDNQVQVGHNVRIGAGTAIAGCVGIAGSAVIGERCMIGGGVGVAGHITLCDGAVIGGMTLVERSIDEPGFYTGAWPVQTHAQWERTAATLKQLPQLRQRLRALASRIGLPKDPS